MNILFVTPYVPSQIRTRPYNLIKGLARLGHHISLLAYSNGSAEEHVAAAKLKEWDVKVELFPVHAGRSIANCVAALPTREPLQAVYAYHPQLEQRLISHIRAGGFDLAHIEHLRASRLVRSTRDIPTVYDSVDCISVLFQQTAQTSPQWRSRWMARLDLDRTRRYEAWLLTQYDHVVITSRRDKLALEQLAGHYLAGSLALAPITVVSNGVDLDYFEDRREPRRRHTIVFTGKMSYHANVAAALYFVDEVLPLIWEELPDALFQIVGKDPPRSIQALVRDGRVTVTGYVDDLRPYLAKASVAVCPIRYAVGIQNKVLEAMAMGTPTISTPAGCAALGVTNGQELLVADGSKEIARAVLRVLSDPDLARRLSRHGRQYVERNHSWETSAHTLTAVYERVRASTGRCTEPIPRP